MKFNILSLLFFYYYTKISMKSRKMGIISHEEPPTNINFKRKVGKEEKMNREKDDEYISFMKRLMSPECSPFKNVTTISDNKCRFSSCYNPSIDTNSTEDMSSYTDDMTIDEHYLEEAMENYKYCGLKNTLENELQDKEQYSLIQRVQTGFAGNFLDLIMTCNQIMKAFSIPDDDLRFFLHNIDSAKQDFKAMNR